MELGCTGARDTIRTGAYFQYHVPVLIQVRLDQPIGRYDTEFINGDRFIKINCLIDSGASVSLVTEELAKNLEEEVVEHGNLTLTTIHDTWHKESHFYN